MPRKREKTIRRGTISESTMQKAAQLCLDNLNMSERSVATKFNINHVTLNRYIKKFKLYRETGSCLPAFGYQPYNKIFDDFQEKQLADYVKISADMYFGLNNRNIRKLAYEFAVKLDLTVPKTWKHNKEAGPDWMTDFLKRNPSVSSYLPKATRISRANHFNPANLNYFMNKYESILLKNKFQAHDVYNMDEIKVTFVQKTRKIVASRGNKLNIKAIKSGKNSSITMCLAINAAGNLIPPMYLISKTANNLNCVQEVEFLKFLKTFAKHVRPSVDNKVLILLDNHVSHLCLPVIDFCKEAGILLLSFPPNCFHKFQPLNTSVFSPFSQFLKENMAVWLQNNPEMASKTYDVPLVSSSASALVSAATPQNIMNGFSLSGIWPLKRDEFMPAVFAETDDKLIDNNDEESIDYVIKEPNNSMTEEPVNNIGITPCVTTEGSLTHPIIDLQQSASEMSQEDIKPFIKLELQDENMSTTEGSLTHHIIDLQQSASEISQEDIKPFIKLELQDENMSTTEGSLTHHIIDLQQSASEISQEDIKPFIKLELQDENMSTTEGSLTHPIIDLQQSASEMSQEDIKPFIKLELQDENMSTTEGSLTHPIIDLQQSASEMSQEDIKPFIKLELQDENMSTTEGSLTHPIIDLQQSASEMSQEDIKPFIKLELQDENMSTTEGSLTHHIIDLQQSASEISQEDIKPFIKLELQDENMSTTKGSLTHPIIDLQQSASEMSQEDIKPFIKLELQDENMSTTEGSLTHPIIDLQQSASEISQEDIKPFIKLELQDKNLINEESISKGKITKLINTPKKLEIEDKTKNHAKRKLGFKNEKSKKSKI